VTIAHFTRTSIEVQQFVARVKESRTRRIPHLYRVAAKSVTNMFALKEGYPHLYRVAAKNSRRFDITITKRPALV